MVKNRTSTTGIQTPRGVYTYWLTRDSDIYSGRPSDKVKVWLAKPDRERIGVGAKWTAAGDDLYCEWTIGECLWAARTYPDDDRMCIRVEGDKVRGPDDPLDHQPNVS